MIDGIAAARDAAYAYQPRNEGEEVHVLFIRACLDDAHLRASFLDDYAQAHHDTMAVREAEAALAVAQQGTPMVQSAAEAGLVPEDQKSESA